MFLTLYQLALTKDLTLSCTCILGSKEKLIGLMTILPFFSQGLLGKQVKGQTSYACLN